MNGCKGCFRAGKLILGSLCSYLNFDSAVVGFEISIDLCWILDYCCCESLQETTEYSRCTDWIKQDPFGRVKGSANGKLLRLTPFKLSDAAFERFQIDKALTTVKGNCLA